MPDKSDSIVKQNTVRSAYNTIAKQYDSDRARFHSDFQLGQFLNHLQKNSKMILDSGCGSGRILNTIHENGFKTVGIDFSKGMLKLSRENAPSSELLEMDMSQVGFKEDTFDGIVAMYSLMHVPKTKHHLVFENIWRILRTGGCMLISLGISELEIVEEYKPYGVQNYWRNADPKLAIDEIRKIGFHIIFDKILEQGGEKFYWIIATKGKQFG